MYMLRECISGLTFLVAVGEGADILGYATSTEHGNLKGVQL
jgi:hypothetical protein